MAARLAGVRDGGKSGRRHFLKQVLAAGDENLCSGDVAEIRAAELEHHVRDFLGRPHAIQRNAGNQRLVFGPDHLGDDLARRDGSDDSAAFETE